MRWRCDDVRDASVSRRVPKEFCSGCRTDQLDGYLVIVNEFKKLANTFLTRVNFNIGGNVFDCINNNME